MPVSPVLPQDSVYIFREGALPPYRQMFYQLCDLNVEEYVRGWGAPPNPPSTVSLSLGEKVARQGVSAPEESSALARAAVGSGLQRPPWAAPLPKQPAVLRPTHSAVVARDGLLLCSPPQPTGGFVTRFPITPN